MNGLSEPRSSLSLQAVMVESPAPRRLRWRTVTLALAGLAAAVSAPGLAWAQERGGDWGWGMHPMSWMWGAWGLGMMVMMLVFWGLVIAGVVLAVRWLTGHGERSRPDRALDILRERYARGEIDKDEFEAKQRDLR
jgi:putative membrane protein